MKIAKNLWQKVLSLEEVIKAFPCELVVCLLAFILNSASSLFRYPEYDNYGYTLAILPLILPLSYFVNILTKEKKARFLYYLVGFLGALLVVFFNVGNSDGKDHFTWVLGVVGEPSLLLCLTFPPIILLARKNFNNQQFAKGEVNYILAFVKSIPITAVACGFLMSIIAVIELLFTGFPHLDTQYISYFCLYFLFPLLLFSFIYHAFKNEETRKSRFGEAIVNYLFSVPAFIYILILNIYTITILISGELPKGMVASLVMGCVISIYLMKSIRTIFVGQNRAFDFLYKHVAWMLILPAFLFWEGLAYRIGEYGITENRVYLIVFGLLMVLWILADLTKKGYNYYLLISVIVLSGLLMLYVPTCSPYQIGMKYQAQELKEMLPDYDLENDILNQDEIQEYVSNLDQKQQKEMKSTVEYFRWEDSLMVEKQGIKYENIDVLLNVKYILNDKYWTDRPNSERQNMEDVKVLKSFRSDALTLDSLSKYKAFVVIDDLKVNTDNMLVFKSNDEVVLKRDVREVVKYVLKRAGVTQEYLKSNDLYMSQVKELIYEDDEVLIVFNSISLDIYSDSELFEEAYFNGEYLFLK